MILLIIFWSDSETVGMNSRRRGAWEALGGSLSGRRGEVNAVFGLTANWLPPAALKRDDSLDPMIWEGPMEDLSAFSARPRLAALLDHFAEIKDARQAWKVMYPLREVLFLVVCGTIASGDDYDDIVDWGKAHLAFLRGFAEFHFGIPCADWLRCIMNRIDPDLFMDCFTVMGRGMLAGQARSRGDRRQDFAAHPQSPDRPQGAASGVGLRHQQPAGARPGGGV